MVKADFRAKYAEHDGSCGDELAAKLKAHVAAADGTVDLAKLKRARRRQRRLGLQVRQA